MLMTDSDDRNGQTCTMCCAGYYQETSIHDDWDGVLHCTNKECNHEVIRYKWKDDPKPQPELVKSKLSPAAQAVLDAWGNVIRADNYEGRVEVPIAAALRTATDQSVPVPPMIVEGGRTYEEAWTATIHHVIRRRFLAIAAELEGVKYGTYRCDLEKK